MVASNSVRIGSAAVAIWSDSQSRGVPAMAAHIAAARPSSSSSMGSVMDRPARSVVGILGLWWGHATSGAVLSSGRLRWGGVIVPAG